MFGAGALRLGLSAAANEVEQCGMSHRQEGQQCTSL
jgi:hypothetical protein